MQKGKTNVVVKRGLVTQSLLAGDLVVDVKASKYMIISDTNVLGLFGDAIKKSFLDANLKFDIFELPPGEDTKSRAMKEAVEDWMLSSQCDRDTCVVAIGGGVVGDLSGYVASTYLRGVTVVQVPTTLLAMVDSSIGGKTGVDTPHGKNLIGAFHQPKRIYVDLSLLDTLPERQFYNGMAEVIKTGAVLNKELFDLLEEKVDQVLARDPETLTDVVGRCALIKAQVVLEDEFEKSGKRALLNFGHTIGHAIEALKQPAMLHGECVAIGMVWECMLARRLGHLHSSTLSRIHRCLVSYHLPVKMPSGLTLDGLMEKMAIDKKNAGGKKKFVICTGVGAALPQTLAVSDDEVRFILSPAVTVTPSTVSGRVSVPGSKSLSNRVLLLAAMGNGPCRIKGLLHSDDTQVMINALTLLGAATFEWEAGGEIVIVHGNGGKLQTPSRDIFLGNAGTASRFLTTLVTVIKDGGSTVLTGVKRMKERPIKDLVDALLPLGCGISYVEKEGCLPLKVEGKGFRGGSVVLSAKISSQFVSSVLLSAPHAEEEVTLKLAEEKSVSQPYVNMTIEVMRQFGINVEKKGENCFVIPKGSYNNPPEFLVEGDASSASYPLAMAAISGGKVTVENVGSKSVQGDAMFFKCLQKMGCHVVQTETTTTVCGKAGPLSPASLDMADVTDTFMTAAVVAAVAVEDGGVTRITGIANQRVKECDRIAAMVRELKKCGVLCEELEDGISITACSSAHGGLIECYHDHRIAMSFAVLGCRVPEVVVLDKECTDKTYAEFWDHMKNDLGVEVVATDVQDGANDSDPSNFPTIVIGMRGAGKTSCSRAAARLNNFDFVDLDDAFVQHVRMPISEFVQANGWDQFRKVELSVLKETIAKAGPKSLIACGGGIVTLQEAREVLSMQPIVIHLKRPIADVVAYLNADKDRPSLGNDPESIWDARKDHYHSCSKYDFHVPAGVSGSKWADVEKDLAHFVQKIRSKAITVPQNGSNSMFVCLTCPDVEQFKAPKELFDGVDAVELRVDLLANYDHDSVAKQVNHLRKITPLPVIYTVRTKEEGGKFNGSEEEYFGLLSVGIRTRCEYVDVEMRWSRSAVSDLIRQKGTSRVLASTHMPGKELSEKDCQQVIVGSAIDGVDVCKVVCTAFSADCSIGVRNAVVKAKSEGGVKIPVIALCMGEIGKLSRVLNDTLTPVTHPALQVVAAPGQLSAAEIISIRANLGMYSRNAHWLFGSPISQSMSPLLHNTGFAHYGLEKHLHYGLCETDDIEVVREKVRQSDFAGANVTIPLKEKVLSLCHNLSDAAKAIGAVNTLSVMKSSNHSSPAIYGDNTDWKAIAGLLRSGFVKRPPSSANTGVGLVIGAGGTARAACFAVKRAGLKLFVHNRTTEKARTLAKEFGGSVAESPESVGAVDAIISTVPPTAKWTAPQFLLKNQPVVIELVYRPRLTPLILQAQEHGCPTVEGIDILIEQGLYGFEAWTGRSAPKDIMASNVRQKYLDEEMK